MSLTKQQQQQQQQQQQEQQQQQQQVEVLILPCISQTVYDMLLRWRKSPCPTSAVDFGLSLHCNQPT